MIFIWLVSFMLMTTNAHETGAYCHDPSNGGYNPEWMKALHDDWKISLLSIPGTHDTMSFYGGDIVECQSISLLQQLEAGIRFLDIRCRHFQKTFSIHHGLIYQKVNFATVLVDVTSFLSSHPSETIFMRVKEEYDAAENDGETFDYRFGVYYNDARYYGYMWSGYDGSVPTLGDVRGKIVIFQNFNGAQYGFPYNSNILFSIQDNYALDSNADLYDKWKDVKKHLETARDGKSSEKFFINYLSGSMVEGKAIVYPYFVASGHSDPRTAAPRLLTGATKPGWGDDWNPDFPRINCFLGICSIAYEGTNVLTMNYIENYEGDISYNLDFVGIIAMDFPGSTLIDNIIAKNNEYKYAPPPLECIQVNGGPSSHHDDSLSEAVCPGGYQLVSCGILGVGIQVEFVSAVPPITFTVSRPYVDGSYISTDDTKCIAQMANDNVEGQYVKAVARCCKLQSTAICKHESSSLSGSNDDDQTSVSCLNSALTGCTAYTYWRHVDGSYPGSYKPWLYPDGVSDIDTIQRCTAANGLDGQGVFAYAQCCSYSDNRYKLQCKAIQGPKSQSTSEVRCPSGWFMSGCSGYSPWNNIGAWRITRMHVCQAQNREIEGGAGDSVWAVAICCQEIDSTSSAQIVPWPSQNVDEYEYNGYKYMNTTSRLLLFGFVILLLYILSIMYKVYKYKKGSVVTDVDNQL